MPDRMSEHGIRALLEILGHQRPESQKEILDYIYLACGTICLFLETALGSMDYVKMPGFDLFVSHVSQCNIAARPRTSVAFL